MRIGFEIRSAARPSLARPISRAHRPERMDSMPASAMARSTLPAAMGRINAAMTAASVESGPSTMMRLGPKTA